MKFKHKDIEGSRKEFSVEIPYGEVKARFEAVYADMKKVAKAPGFRKGSVPRDILEKQYGDSAREKVFSNLVTDSYREALTDTRTRPVGMPVISDVKFKEGEDFSFKATVDVRPKIELKNYKNIKIKKARTDVSDEDIENYLSSLRESYAQFKDIEGRSAELGDYIICDSSCEIDGKAVAEEQKNVRLFMDREQSIPGLVDGLVGASKGERKLIKATLPDNAAEPQYSKKEALFKIKVNEIKEKELPKIDDEFIRGLGTYKDVSELKRAAHKDIARKKENKARADMSYRLLEELLKNARFAAPKGLVEEEAERMAEDVKAELRARHISDEDIKKKEEDLRKNAAREAERRVRLFFLLDEIGMAEDIKVSTKELDDAMAQIAAQSGTTKDAVREQYAKNNLIGVLRNQLRESKIIDFLLANADVKEE